MPAIRVAALSMLVLVPSAARAAEPTFHTTAELSVSYSDNILAAPDNPPRLDPPVEPPASDVLLRIAPGVAMIYETARMKWTARYSHPFIFFIEHTGSDTDADVLHLEAELTPSDLDELELAFDLARFTTSLSTLQASDETTIGPQRGTSSTIVTVGLATEWTRQLSLSWAWTQSASAGSAIPVDGGTTMLTASLRAGPRLSLDDHAFGLVPSITYSAPLTDDPLGETGFQSSQQVLLGGRAEWQWAFAPPDWATAARAGVIAALEGEDTEVQPVGGAALRFQREGYAVALSCDRGYVPNLITGQTFFTNGVTLRGSIPIVADHDVRASTGSGFALSRAIDVPRSVDVENVKTVIADAAVGWYPDLYPHVEVRYQYTRQWDAPADQIVLPNFNRNVFSFSVSYMWPPVELTLPKGYRQKPEEALDPLAPIR